ncbi:MAPEG family protein [Aquabacterium sp. A7-Y]|uniref:MAPEG family protein n=1 Tax=Aquabacterium sp. A7-Y TaxID=1349605 RepID=UPI00223CEA52|nr:MAPEG family protein [Aquabacterium sp. A7-Y]MCW7540387.1 MAPEG family protein [Aquabacterium sp. A7-Y]
MNIALWSVLAAALLPIVCVFLAKAAGIGRRRSEGGYDNHDPRSWLARQQGWRQRANAAQANSFEALPFFIGAVAIAFATGAPAERVDLLAAAFVGLRIVYIGLYIADLATLRSLVWTLALAVNIALLFSGSPARV